MFSDDGWYDGNICTHLLHRITLRIKWDDLGKEFLHTWQTEVHGIYYYNKKAKFLMTDSSIPRVSGIDQDPLKSGRGIKTSKRK